MKKKLKFKLKKGEEVTKIYDQDIYNQTYEDKNPEKLNNKCECGSNYTLRNKTNHESTQKHIKFMDKKLNEEIKNEQELLHINNLDLNISIQQLDNDIKFYEQIKENYKHMNNFCDNNLLLIIKNHHESLFKPKLND